VSSSKSPTGIVLLDKPAGISSAAAVAKVKRVFGPKAKVGHSGTLDPFASGLLVCLLGSATRLARFFQSGHKRYSGIIRLGITTDSDDITGSIIAQNEVALSDSEILDSSKKFLGKIMQAPPRISAVKINGERAYRRARNGEDFEIKTREVLISKFEVTRLSVNQLGFVIECGSGTYIRSIARDLGEILSCGATLETLRREASSPFDLSDALTLDQLSNNSLRPWIDGFRDDPYVKFESHQVQQLLHGDRSPLLIEHGRIRKLADSGAKSSILIYGDEVPRGIISEQDGVWKVELNINSESPAGDLAVENHSE